MKPWTGYAYRLWRISIIENDLIRRTFLLLTFPIFFCFNILASIPAVFVGAFLNQRLLIKTTIERWERPVDNRPIEEVLAELGRDIPEEEWEWDEDGKGEEQKWTC